LCAVDGEAFYRQLDEGLFEATKWTRGPWNPEHQHAGPPSALVAGQLAAMWSDAFRVVRVSIEIPRPVPIGGLRLERSLRRDGSMVKVATGRLFDDAGKLVLSAEALALAEAELDLEGTQPPMEEALPRTGRAERFPFFDEGSNYAAAMELRFTRGAFGDGDVMAWLRMRMPLLQGRFPSPIERVLIAADSGNGVSQRSSIRDFTFVNPDLTVTLHGQAEGEWIGLGARTDLDGRGIGVADTRLYDERGPIGRGVQTLIVRNRSL
jgi:hypothetical protein